MIKSAIVSTVILVISVTLAWPVHLAAESKEPEGKKDRVSYSLGHQIGRDMKREGQVIDPDAFLRGLTDANDRLEPLIGQKVMEDILLELKKSIVSRQRFEKQEMKEQRFGAGKEFLAQNALKEGVVVLPSGLQYRVIRAGTGRRPGLSDRVTVRYRGSMIDGTPFHDSTEEGEPEKFRVAGVVKGLTEALQLMKEGARWEIFIPPDLAYGQRGLLANRTVIFDLQLFEVEPTQ